MTARNHLASSMSVSLLPLLVFPPLPLPLVKLYLVGVVIGALTPDCDEPQSYIGNRMRIVSDLLHELFGHRGVTHTLAALLFYVAVFLFVRFMFPEQFDTDQLAAFGVGFLTGNLLHMLGDMMTKEGGIALFYPISRKRLYLLPKALRFRTNGIVENLVISPLFAVLLAYAVYQFYAIYLQGSLTA